MARQKKTEYINAVNVWIDPDWDGAFALSVEYVDSETDAAREVYKTYRTQRAQLKAANKYGCTVTLI